MSPDVGKSHIHTHLNKEEGKEWQNEGEGKEHSNPASMMNFTGSHNMNLFYVRKKCLSLQHEAIAAKQKKF